MNKQLIISQIRSVLAYSALYLILSVLSFIVIMFSASTIIMNDSNNELGRAADGIFAVYLGVILSFFVISPFILLCFSYWKDKKGKRKVKNVYHSN
jgi:hypothetical protein